MAETTYPTQIEVGTSVKRVDRRGVRQGVIHLVESLIADRVVTKCGKQMHRVASKGKLVLSGDKETADAYCWACF